MIGQWALAENLRESQGTTGDSRGQPGTTREHMGISGKASRKELLAPLASDYVMVDQ